METGTGNFCCVASTVTFPVTAAAPSRNAFVAVSSTSTVSATPIAPSCPAVDRDITRVRLTVPETTFRLPPTTSTASSVTCEVDSESMTPTARAAAAPLAPLVSERTLSVLSTLAWIVAFPVVVRLPASVAVAFAMSMPAAGPKSVAATGSVIADVVARACARKLLAWIDEPAWISTVAVDFE